MRFLMTVSVILLASVCAQAQQASLPVTRFAVADVYIETSDQAPLAAYQLDINAEGDGVKLVGIEGGEHPAFDQPPYYDPAALQRSRVIIAAFSTSADLPAGRTRVARLHLQLDGAEQVELKAQPIVIANADGHPIAAKVTIVEGDQP